MFCKVAESIVGVFNCVSIMRCVSSFVNETLAAVMGVISGIGEINELSFVSGMVISVISG
jgi:hypothetical protein